jgi:hypothetical protein
MGLSVSACASTISLPSTSMLMTPLKPAASHALRKTF